MQMNKNKFCNLVLRVSHLPAPWSERRETLVNSGHVRPKIWDVTNKKLEGGAAGGGKMRDPGNEVEHPLEASVDILFFELRLVYTT